MSLPKTELTDEVERGKRMEDSSFQTTAAATNDEPIQKVELSVVAAVVLEDNAELGPTVTRLRALCVALGDGRPPADPGPVRLIEEFESQLIAHFNAEDAEDAFGSLVKSQPRLLTRVERLQAEHGQITRTLDELLEFAGSDHSVVELGIRIGHVLDRFDAHESAENELMQELLLLDEGGGG